MRKEGPLECDLDCRIEKVQDQERLELSLVGQDEEDEVSGRGWAVLDGDLLRGRFYFHDGEESGFIAKNASNFNEQHDNEGTMTI
jgi:hypothetical protein